MNKNHHQTFRLLALAFFVFLLTACSPSQRIKAQASSATIKDSPVFMLPYDFSKPDARFKLPKKLLEISGLSLSHKPGILAAIQDEDGIIFLLDKNTGEVVEKIPFGKPGDYEGLERVGKDLFVVKSSGKIYHIKNIGEPLQEIFKYKTPLNKAYDVEGLGYDPKQNCLLLACKGQPDTESKEDRQFTKAIYRFHLDKKELDTIPTMVIDRQDILDYFETHPLWTKVNKEGEVKETDPRKIPCYPSAIALHPITGHYYITSSRGKVLFIVAADGHIIHIEKLKKKIHPQPEGLVFDRNGNLYLSNEGGEDPAKIYRFDYQKVKNQ